MINFKSPKSSATQIQREMEIKEFRIACGEFVGLGDISRAEWEKQGMALVLFGVAWSVGMFAARARGGSMEPKIRNRMWCLFHPEVVGTRQHRVVLVEDRRKNGIDRYTLKKYYSCKSYSPDGTWEHEEVWLLPLNLGYSRIRLEKDGDYCIRGWFVRAVSRSQIISA